MKIAIECQSPLLQKSLEIFLAQYVTSQKSCDIVVRDTPCVDDERCFYISTDKDADLIKPFSKSQLILALQKRYKETHIEEEVSEIVVSEEERDISVEEVINIPNFEILEKRIELLTQEYQKNILNAVRAFYEK
jgi:hypothetical protein